MAHTYKYCSRIQDCQQSLGVPTSKVGISRALQQDWLAKPRVTIHCPCNHRVTAAPGNNTRAGNTTIQFTFLHVQKFFSELKQADRFVQAQ